MHSCSCSQTTRPKNMPFTLPLWFLTLIWDYWISGTLKTTEEVSHRWEQACTTSLYNNHTLTHAGHPFLAGTNTKSHCSPTRARNRWLVAYTLIRNPSIQSLTASGIKRQFRCELQATTWYKYHDWNNILLISVVQKPCGRRKRAQSSTSVCDHFPTKQGLARIYGGIKNYI